MPNPLSHQLEICDQAITKNGERCSWVSIESKEINTWTSVTIYSCGIELKTKSKDEAYSANRAFAERIVKALALLEFFEVCEPTKQFLNTYHENN